LPDAAGDLWDEAVEMLIEAGAAQLIDGAAIQQMCIAYAHAEEARQIISAEGMISVGYRGQPVEHPAVRIFERSSALFLRYAEQFGLTTLARTRLGLIDVKRRTLTTSIQDRLGPNPRLIGRDRS
jgi:P27 family predicted phage terminase small subunit